MVLVSRSITKSSHAAMVAASAAPQRSSAKPGTRSPPVLQSGHAPAQLCFSFKRG